MKALQNKTGGEAKRLEVKHLSSNIRDCRVSFESGAINALMYMSGINKQQEKFPKLNWTY